MKNKREYLIILYTVAALLLDFLGRVISDNLMLPVWGDFLGTALLSYMAGPVCGVIAGAANCILYGGLSAQTILYGVVGALLGFLVGLAAKKGAFKTQYATMTLGMGLALLTTISSSLIDWFLQGGECGNVWEEQVMLLCLNNEVPKHAAFVLGHFCMEFVDKLVCMELVFLIIRFVRAQKKRKLDSVFWKNIGVMSVFAAIVVTGFFMGQDTVLASVSGYDSYMERIYSNEEGLLTGEASDIEQTRDGMLWIGSYAGLFQYDGSSFDLLNEISSIKNVNCLYVDDEGRLLVGTNDNGVTILTDGSISNVITEEDGLLADSVKDIVSDSDGNYYIGTANGVSFISLSGGATVENDYTEIDSVDCMAADHDGNVVIITEHGELYWIQNGSLVESPIKENQKETLTGSQTEENQEGTLTESQTQENQEGTSTEMSAEESRERTLHTAFFTADGRLILGTAEGEVLIYRVSDSQAELECNLFLDDMGEINSFYETREGDIFACTDNGIAAIYADFSYEKLNTGDFISGIESMLVDFQGNLWFASSRHGLLELCKSSAVDLFSKIDKTSVVNATEKWQGLLYCGTDEGLIVMDENAGTEITNELTALLEGVRIRCVKTDSRDRLWVSTAGQGVYCISLNADGTSNIKQFTEEDGLPGMRFRQIMEAENGDIYIAGDYGVAVIAGDTLTGEDAVTKTYTSSDGLINEKTLCMLESDGVIYLGSDGGGIMKIEDGVVTKSISKKSGLSSDVILRMTYDATTGGIFVVTSNSLCYLFPNGEIRELENFPYSNNYDLICEEDGTCLILGSAGVYVANAMDLVMDKEQEYPLIDAKRGLTASLNSNAWVCREGENLYLCCDNGAVKLNLSSNDTTAKSYRMSLDGAEVDGTFREFIGSHALQLSADAKKIVITPKILNYSVYDPYVTYILEGYDAQETTCRLSELGSVTYSDLTAGTYTFKISILDDKNGEAMETAVYTFEKENEMYHSLWFKLYVAFVIACVLSLITWFFTRMQAQKTLLKQKYELEFAKKELEMADETILSIAKTVDAKDSYTSKHSERVSEYAVAIAKELAFTDAECDRLRKMALLHDIGKIGIPDAILNKPEGLTEEEYELMKSHVTKGAEILKDFKMIDGVDVGARYHHERYDGSGYCQGLKGEEIPLEARIIGIADAFDAMTVNRVYHERMDMEEVIQELREGAGKQFDPRLVKIMISLIQDKTINVNNLQDDIKGAAK